MKSAVLLELTEKALEIARRWVKITMGEGYSVSSVTIINTTQKIQFHTYPITSGLGQSFAIDLGYLDDASQLEKNALAWRKEDQEKRAAQLNRLNELERHPVILEYKKLTNPYVHYNNLTTFTL